MQFTYISTRHSAFSAHSGELAHQTNESRKREHSNCNCKL